MDYVTIMYIMYKHKLHLRDSMQKRLIILYSLLGHDIYARL